MIILADDLTGANDTAVQYKNCGASSIVSVGMPDSESISRFAGYDVISVNTDSRAMPSAKAYDAVYKACRFFNKNGAAAPYKKIDSVLRGNPGAELDAVMDSFESDFAFVCPAYPENGRVVKSGILHAGDDKIDAVKTVAGDMKRSVRSVPLEVVRDGAAAVGKYMLGEASKSGASVFVLDACSESDLKSIYDAALSFPEKYVLCGSAGLARFDAMRFAEKKKEAAENLPLKDGFTLVISGSRNKKTRMQFQKLCDYVHTRCIVADTKTIKYGGESKVVNDCFEKAARRIAAGDTALLVVLSSLFEDFRIALKDSDENYREADVLSRALGKLAARIYEAFPLRAIVSCGGDTTVRLCNALGAFGIEPVCEIVPGTPLGILVGGKADSLPIITKSGGFGDDSVLIECVDFLLKYTNHDGWRHI